MCTAVVSIDPSAEFPVLLAGVRDEFHDRAWVPPGRHWAGRPDLVGGWDLLAGGTWLAVHPGIPRVGVVLNGIGPHAPEARRLSRGDLPLRFAQDGTLDGLEFDRYDPFHLVCAEVGAGGAVVVRLLGWNGRSHVERVLDPGLHLVVNSGLEGLDVVEDGPGRAEMAARVAYFRPRLAAAGRPVPSAGTAAQAWGSWLPLVDGDGLADSDPRALVLRREVGDGRIWGTTSTTLVALRSGGGVRYDFSSGPGDPLAWSTVLEPQ